MKEFLDEFKRLERLCSDIYGEKHGVTEYINDMEQTSSFIAGRIPGWSNDLAKLKRVRYIRNGMAHEDGFDDAYEPEDLEFIKKFHQRILEQQDPLAMRHRLTQNATSAKLKSAISTVKNSSTYSFETTESDIEAHDINQNYNRNVAGLKIIVVPCVIILIIVLWLLLNLY